MYGDRPGFQLSVRHAVILGVEVACIGVGLRLPIWGKLDASHVSMLSLADDAEVSATTAMMIRRPFSLIAKSCEHGSTRRLSSGATRKCAGSCWHLRRRGQWIGRPPTRIDRGRVSARAPRSGSGMERSRHDED
jgi:hypothetical protein